jgi:hypothetical protein
MAVPMEDVCGLDSELDSVIHPIQPPPPNDVILQMVVGIVLVRYSGF